MHRAASLSCPLSGAGEPTRPPDRPSKILLVQVWTLSSSPIPRLGCLFSFFQARDWRALPILLVQVGALSSSHPSFGLSVFFLSFLDSGSISDRPEGVRGIHRVASLACVLNKLSGVWTSTVSYHPNTELWAGIHNRLSIWTAPPRAST